ncbi:MAG: DNA polymerase III subunit alpha [bacterium]|nr:DNA polymerase III subunit alpha [bacterium]MBU1916800.1 DNA polymerase III subunit alpha [bacterium]
MYCHLHLHTEYSLLNGAVRTKDAISRAKEYNMPALAITDYGNLYGAVEFFSTATASGIKPILGCEVYIPSYNDHTIKKFVRGQDVYWQLVLLVQNEIGYKNLSRLITRSFFEGFYYKPRVDFNLLREYQNGLIALSSGYNSEINHHIYNDNYDDAKKAAQNYAQLFPGRFYLELQNNGLPNQPETNDTLIQLAKDLGLPLVASNNIHYMNPDDAEAFEILRSIQIAPFVTSPYDALKFSTDRYHFKSQDEMQADFSHCEEALKNTIDIASKCNFDFEYGTYHLPKYETPENKTLDDYLADLARLGLKERWDQIQKLSSMTDDDWQAYQNRLEHEIGVINSMGFAGYFLIVADFINWAKKQKIPVGPGRGSGAGSLVAYSLRITDIDPIPYNLLFERFLNPERISMPDFDIDFCQEGRAAVIEYVTEKYVNVSQIITFGKMKARAVIRDVGRVLDLEYDYVDKLAKLIPNTLGIKLKDAIATEPELKKRYENDETDHRLLDVSMRLEGLNRHASVHAAGVIITDKPLWEHAPLYKGSNNDVVVQYDMKCAEKIGLIKFDFLGLRTLTVINKAIKYIKKTKDLIIDITTIPMDDEAVFHALSQGDGFGVFQLESAGMRDLMERLQPNCFEDIIALVALYRPGPLGSGMVDDFIERKKGKKDITYMHPSLNEILKDTYGVIVYQEQVMQIASILASYTLGEADLLRRAMGKKIISEMAAQKKRFLSGAEKNKIDPKIAEDIFDLMAKFAEYGFNKSHSAAYALISYQTSWLKTHHRTEFIAAIMSTEMEDTDKILLFIDDAKKADIKMLAPNINESEAEFSVAAEKHIRYGLAALKGVGGAAIESIIETRNTDGPFQSFYDFCSRVDLRRVTKKVIDVLIKAGAFDDFKMPRQGLFTAIEQTVNAAAKKQRDEALGQSNLFASLDLDEQLPVGLEIKNDMDWTEKEKLTFEKEVFGFYFSGHPLKVYQDNLHKLTTHNTKQIHQLPSGTEVTIGGVITSMRSVLTKKNDKMAFLQFEDLLGPIEVIVFPKALKKCQDLITSEHPLVISGRVERSETGGKLFLENIVLLSEKLKQTTRSVHLHIPLKQLTSKNIAKAMEILHQYQGQSRIYIHANKTDDYDAIVELPSQYRAMACEPLQYHINQLFDDKVVRFM